MEILVACGWVRRYESPDNSLQDSRAAGESQLCSSTKQVEEGSAIPDVTIRVGQSSEKNISCLNHGGGRSRKDDRLISLPPERSRGRAGSP